MSTAARHGVHPGRSSPDPIARRPIHAVDRRREILERVAAEQAIHVPALARELAVSEMTIRRDIRRLERDGFVRQTYGGATAHLTRSFDVSFNARALEHSREKRLIGMRATELIGTARVVTDHSGNITRLVGISPAEQKVHLQRTRKPAESVTLRPNERVKI